MALYEKLGIRFQYPENWHLDERETDEQNASVTVYSPGGAFWSVSSHPPECDPRELADSVLKTMREEYSDLDSEIVQESVAGRNLIGHDIDFYCLDLTNTARVRGFRTPGRTYLVMSQADDREFEQIEQVFLAMTTSLLRGA